MDDTKQTTDELVDGPVSPRTDVSSPGEATEPRQTKTETQDFAVVPPYRGAPDNQPNNTPDLDW